MLEDLREVNHILTYVLRTALTIHRPELIEAVGRMTYDRSQPLPIPEDPVAELLESPEARQVFARLDAKAVPELEARLSAVQANQKQLRSTIGAMRKLIDREFAFNDSFV